jgi:hypothetical protein
MLHNYIQRKLSKYMAHKQKIEFLSEAWRFLMGKEHLWNITHPVGIGCVNLPEDVMLVQYMLYKIHYYLPAKLRPTSYIKVDGIYGPQTNKWIRHFQSKWCNMIPDGKIKPCDGKTYYFKDFVPFTICGINDHLYLSWQHHFDDIRKDPYLPAELCFQLCNAES